MDREAVLARIASKQYDVFSYDQALSAGLSPRAVQRRLDAGRWQRLYRKVYVTAGKEVGWEQRVFGATLARGPGAIASRLSAGKVWELTERWDGPDVTVAHGRSVRTPGIVVHRSAPLDSTTFRGFPVTTPMRTLVDLAIDLSDEELERCLDAALRRRLVDIKRMRTFLQLERNVRRTGVASLRTFLDIRQPGRALGSDLETIFLRAVRQAGLPLPIPQFPVDTARGTAYIDFAYPQRMLAIEVDGFESHGTPAAFDDDHERQALLEDLGWTFRRYSWRQVRDDAAGTAIRVGRALGLRPVKWRQT